MTENIPKSKKNKKRSPVGKILISLLMLIVLLIGIGVGSFYFLLDKMENIVIDKDNLGITTKEELSIYDNHKKIKNIALFGIDSDDGTGRSDAIMIATIDSAHKKLKLTSIMRDSYVNIDGYGKDKINHAYAFGGPELAIKTINQNFGLNIENFIAVDFASLPRIIDMIGGLELEITADEYQFVNAYVTDINNQDGVSSPPISGPGVHTVNGVQALAYSRIRYTEGGDYRRTERQRDVLEGLFKKALSLPVSKYPGLVSDILPLVKTNLTASQVLGFSTDILTLGTTQLTQERFPRDGACWGETINGIYYLVFDEAVTKQGLMDYIFDDR